MSDNNRDFQCAPRRIAMAKRSDPPRRGNMEDVLSECSDICEEYSSRDDDDVIDYDDNINDPDYFLPSDHNNNNG